MLIERQPHFESRPMLREMTAESARRYADDNVRSAIDNDAAADDVCGGAEPDLPGPAADHDFRRAFGETESWPARKRRAERREIVPRHVHGVDTDAGSAAGGARRTA